MIEEIRLPVVESSQELENLREEVRSFINQELKEISFKPNCDAWMADSSPEFSKKLAERGWLGVTVPRKYGGKEGTNFEKYVINEELLAAGAPVAAHWVTDRQIVPLLLRYGTEKQKKAFLPKICKGELFFSIGLSEYEAGSDLASVTTHAQKRGNKYVINGKKAWINGAHIADYMTILCRTGPHSEKNKYRGLSQIMVNLRLDGVTVNPIKSLTGEDLFYEVIFEDVLISEDMLLGQVGNGWEQCMAELSYERSGSERFLSTLPLLESLINVLRKESDPRAEIEIGKLVSQLWVLRKMSLGIAALLETGEMPKVIPSIVKDLGTRFEKQIINTSRSLIDDWSNAEKDQTYAVHLGRALLHSPIFTLRGGTTEILRSIVAKGLGVR